MAQLQLHFLHQGRHPIRVEDELPTKGVTYTLEHCNPDGTTTPESWVVSLIRRQLWPKSKYDSSASPHEYLPGDHWEILLVRPEDVASGKIKI